MGLRPGLSHIRPSRRRTSDLVAPIQLASASRWYKISNAYQPTRSHRGQPLEAPQLERDDFKLKHTGPLLPRPALRGERVGVRGYFHELGAWRVPLTRS